MNRLLIAVAIILCSLYGCKKENKVSAAADAESTSEIVASCDDGEDLSKTYSPNETNEFSEYSFGGVAGTYFGYRSTFVFNEKAKIDISFGTILSTNTSLTSADILSLVSPGEKLFGSLGSYTSYPKLVPNRVEIAFTDDKSHRWCSTSITEKQTSWGVETQVEVKQAGSEFTVDKVTPVQLKDSRSGFRVKGHFDCILYEVNGKHHKKIKGSFTGVISETD